MAHVILDASLLDNLRAHGQLLDSGHLLTFVPSTSEMFSAGENGPPVLLNQVDGAAVVPSVGAAARRNRVPWVAWNLTDCADVALAAYEEGASAVLPSTFSAAAFDGIVRTVIEGCDNSWSDNSRSDNSESSPPEPELRSYQSGDRIPLAHDVVLWVQQGVVALTALHEDGMESLTGFCGPGQVVTGSVDLASQPVAHTGVVVSTQPWSLAAQLPGLSERLRERLREAQAWAHSRGHHHVDTRLLATLTLLAQKFGVDDPAGTLVDIPLTHAQLAAATASTRATVTRRLAALGRRGLLTTVPTDAGNRLTLTRALAENRR